MLLCREIVVIYHNIIIIIMMILRKSIHKSREMRKTANILHLKERTREMMILKNSQAKDGSPDRNCESVKNKTQSSPLIIDVDFIYRCCILLGCGYEPSAQLGPRAMMHER